MKVLILKHTISNELKQLKMFSLNFAFRAEVSKHNAKLNKEIKLHNKHNPNNKRSYKDEK